MSSEFESQSRRESLLQTVAELCAARDHLVSCAEMLREYLFIADTTERQRALKLADEIIASAKVLR
jgi:hypothetical protein